MVVISFLVPTVRTYFQQNAEMEALSEQIAQEEQRQAELYSQLQRWDDPEFVRQQARERINLVMPGERRYHVIGDLSEADVENVADEVAEDEDEWTETLWESVVESADE
nr:septum formation initiator family protein [Garicola koreensis]